MSFRAPTIEKCVICNQTVYAMEKMQADGLVFHKNCMKCTECGKTLGLGNYAALSGKYYCKPHFKQLFALKGNYSEGFGEEKPTAKWTQQEAQNSPTPVHRSPPREQEPPSDVVKSGSNKEDVASIVAGGEHAPSDARKKFQELAVPGADNSSVSPSVARKAAGSPFSVRREVCHVCSKTVYEMEKMVADGLVFHKNCMKCTECGKTLGLGNYAALSGKYYCKPHFKQLFALKGNYSEGFGEEKPTAKWTHKGDDSGAAESEPAAATEAEAEPEAEVAEAEAEPEVESAEAEPEAEPEAEAEAEPEAEAEAAADE